MTCLKRLGLLLPLLMFAPLCGEDKVLPHGELLTYSDEAGQPQAVKTPADWEKRRAQILKGMEQAMGELPSRENLPPLDIQEKAAEAKKGDGYVRQTITFATEAGDRLTADLYRPDPLPKGKLPAILALHSTGALGKRIVAGEGGRVNRAYGVELAQRGYVVIAPDYPSFGDHANYDFDKDRYVSGTMKGIWNHMRCVDLLQSLPEVDGERIGVIGHSLGGHNSMFAGVFDPRLKVIVSSCGWTPFHDYYGGKIAGWTSPRYMPKLKDDYGLDPDKVPFDFYEVVAALAPRAFFSSSPVSDSNFDVNGVKKAIPKAAQVYELLGAKDNLQVRYPICEHDFPTETREESYAFIDQILKHQPTRKLDFSAELPRIEPLEPAEAMKAFQLLPGFRIERTACEPLVTDPVAMAFDARGRLFVVEMRDYSEQDKAMLGRIRVLTDKNGDGLFDDSAIYAEGLSWPTAIICWDGGIFVGAPPHIYYIKDVDGDLKADEQKIVFTGFGRSNVQGLLNSFRWGLDNRIHAATSSSGGDVVRPDVPDMKPLSLRGRDFSFDPRTLDIRPESGGAQHGFSFDDFGRKFVCSNSDHAQMVMFEDRYVTRNPWLAPPSPRISIADDGGQAPVFRTSPVEPWRIVRTRLRVSGQVKGAIEGGGRAAGYFTGATGIMIYRGDALPELRGLAFIGDVGSNIVHRKKLTPNGLQLVASRIDKDVDFLTSPDIWFRPVQFANGPDGCLHVLDMYREVIEHPASLPPEIKRHLDLTSGRDRGRLYRVKPEKEIAAHVVNLEELPSVQLVEQLAQANSWHRETAAKLLFERQDVSIISALEKTIAEGKRNYTRIAALSVLRGLTTPAEEVLLKALNDPDEEVRRFAVQCAETQTGSPAVRSKLAEMASDESLRVRYQLAFTAGEFPVAWRLPVLERLLLKDAGDQWVRVAALSSLNHGAGTMLADLLAADQFAESPAGKLTLTELARIVARQNDSAEVAVVLNALNQLRDKQPARVAAVVLELGKSNAELKQTLAADASAVLPQLLKKARQTVKQASSDAEKAAAIRTLRLGSYAEDAGTLIALLDPQQPAAVQQATLETLGAFDQPQIAETILERWKNFSPSVRDAALDVLFSRPAWTAALLSRLIDQKLPLADVPVARLQLLSQSRDENLKKQAAVLLSRGGPGKRDEIVKAYQTALELTGDVNRGRETFRKVCASCHRLEDHGEQIGPDLRTIRNRGVQTILLNVLDPNREVNPQYLNYVALTADGLTHTGMIASETATSVTLREAKKPPVSLLRQELEELRSSGLSLMPEGIEKDISPQAMADLLAYLNSIQ